jgi:hypothetical protein
MLKTTLILAARMNQRTQILPEEDGVSHINIGTEAKTWLGREMAPTAHRPFKHYAHGTFASVEGYSLWLTRQDEALRNLYGQEATEFGDSLPVVKRWTKAQYTQHVNVANASKIHAHPDLKTELMKSVLPIEQYVVEEINGQKKVTHVPDSEEKLAWIEGLRREENPEADISHCHRTLERFSHERDLEIL